MALGVDEGEYVIIASKVPASADVTWASDNEDVATVTEIGFVRGISAGTATVSASIVVNGITYYDTLAITVIE